MYKFLSPDFLCDNLRDTVSQQTLDAWILKVIMLI